MHRVLCFIPSEPRNPIQSEATSSLLVSAQRKTRFALRAIPLTRFCRNAKDRGPRRHGHVFDARGSFRDFAKHFDTKNIAFYLVFLESDGPFSGR